MMGFRFDPGQIPPDGGGICWRRRSVLGVSVRRDGHGFQRIAGNFGIRFPLPVRVSCHAQPSTTKPQSHVVSDPLSPNSNSVSQSTLRRPPRPGVVSGPPLPNPNSVSQSTLRRPRQLSAPNSAPQNSKSRRLPAGFAPNRNGYIIFPLAAHVMRCRSGIPKGLRPFGGGVGGSAPCASPYPFPLAAHVMRCISGIPKGLRPFGRGAGGSAPCASPCASPPCFSTDFGRFL